MSDMMNTTSTASAEIQHTNRAHARLNASSSHRWMMCPPSVKLSEQFEDKPSTYAEEGSFLHELCELKLHRYLGDMTAEAVEVEYAEHRDSEFYSDEAESVTDEYVAFCIETIEAVRSSCPDPLIMVEHRLDYSEYVPEGFGTGDLVIVADGVIEVVDFKSGRGVRVDAHRNSQLMLYALGALMEFDPLYDIHHVRMTIVQPRLNNLSSCEMEADELLRWAETEVRPKALLAYEGKGEFCAGEWCRFCKARYTCRKRSEYHMRLAERDFKQPDLLSDEEIADILPVAESLNSWVQDLMSSARLRGNHLFIRNASSGRKFTFQDLLLLYHRAALLHRKKIRKIHYAFIKDLQEAPDEKSILPFLPCAGQARRDGFGQLRTHVLFWFQCGG